MEKTDKKSYSTASVGKLPGSKVEITGSLAPGHWEVYRAAALKNLNENVSLDGFRKGNIPENILIAKVGEMAILEEMAELALPKAYLDILIDNKIDAIGKPAIQVTKLAKGNPLEFKATTAVVPEVGLPDYKKIAAKEVGRVDPSAEAVTDKDVEDAILRIRKAHATRSGHSKGDHKHDEKSVEESLPELNDEFVKKIGSFENVADFKAKMREIVAEEKKLSAKEMLRLKIADAISSETKVELPEVMIESEINRTEAQFKADIERMGVKLEDYLKHAKKSAEDIRKEWRPHAEKKARLQLILNAIAKAENIKPSKEEVEAEVSHIISHYKDADRERAAVYAETVLTNEKVFQFLTKRSE